MALIRRGRASKTRAITRAARRRLAIPVHAHATRAGAPVDDHRAGVAALDATQGGGDGVHRSAQPPGGQHAGNFPIPAVKLVSAAPAADRKR
jgi:hypothetical protein